MLLLSSRETSNFKGKPEIIVQNLIEVSLNPRGNSIKEIYFKKKFKLVLNCSMGRYIY